VVISTKTCNQLRQLNDGSKFNKNALKALAKKNLTIFGQLVDIKFISVESIENSDKKCIEELKEFAFRLNERIFYYEFDIMSNIGFDLDLDLPFKYIDQMSVYFKKFLPQLEQKLTKLALTFMDNFYIFPICLNYEPIYIVLTCYNLIIKNCNITFPNLSNGKKWYDMFMVDFNNEKMNEIGKQMSILSKITMVKENKNTDQSKSNKDPNNKDLNKNNNKVEDFNLSFYKINNKNSNNSTNIEDNKVLHVDSIKFNENKEYKEYKEYHGSIDIRNNCSLQNPKSTYSEKVTMDSDSCLDEQAFI